MPGTGKGIPPEAHPVGEETRAGWEAKRSIATGRERDDYFDEWGRSPSNLSAVNELNGSSKRKTEMSYVLLGACREYGRFSRICQDHSEADFCVCVPLAFLSVLCYNKLS